MITIKDYAKGRGVSYQAINQQIKKHEKELKDHIIVQDKIRYLDDEAVEFLNQKRKSNPIMLIRDEDMNQIRQLESQNKALLAKIVELQDKAIKDKENYIALQDKYSELLAITMKKEEATDQDKPAAEQTEDTTTQDNRFKRAWRELWKK